MVYPMCALISSLTSVRLWTVRAAVTMAITLACFPAAPRAQAQTTIAVTNLNDSGPGSLRAAITNAASGQSSIVSFASGLSGTIPLQSTLSVCNGQTLTIQGPTASQIAVSGQNSVRVFYVCPNTNVTISGLTIEDGLGSDAGDFFFGGGGIANLGTLTVTNSTFSGNSSGSATGTTAAWGGGILNLATLTVTNTTFSGNVSSGGGGGIFNAANVTYVTNSTFSGNVGNGIGDGTPDGSTSIVMKSTLLAGNTGGNCAGVNIAPHSQGYNLSDDASCGFFNPLDKNNTPAGLNPNGLQNNGGPTKTIALLPTSPAVDAIPITPTNECTDTSGKPVTTDQRGVSRPQGKGCDIGAYEFIQSVPFASFTADLGIFTKKPYGYALIAEFTAGASSTGLNPATGAVTLQIAGYMVTIPAGSFKQVGMGTRAPYSYEGTINGVTMWVVITPLGGNRYGLAAAGSPVNLTGATNPVTVTLTIGNNSGTTAVKAIQLP
jgi:hypothetical protein